MATSRRRFLASASAFAAASALPIDAFADQLAKTAAMAEGPFYPDKLPLDTDNDLILLNDSTASAVGEVTYLTGQVLSKTGQPIRNASVEIWQCDGNGVYLHSGSSTPNRRDGNFQGYGRFLTNAKGEYCFRTIKPVAYPGRTPHIHVAVNQNGHRILTTQMFIKGDTRNHNDGLIRRIKNQEARNTLMVDFTALPEAKIKTWQANFDIVLGKTVEDA